MSYPGREAEGHREAGRRRWHASARLDNAAGHCYLAPMPKPARRVLGSIRHGDAAGPLISLATRVPATLSRRLHAYCARRGVKVQRFVTDAIREALHRRHCDSRRVTGSPPRANRRHTLARYTAH